MATPRVRMFAGPNGSGKSTLKTILPQDLLGIYLNPDEMEKEIRASGFLRFETFGVQATADEAREFFLGSQLFKQAGLAETVNRLNFANDLLQCPPLLANAYIASVAADFVRQKLLDQKVSFTFETVMSSPDKIELLDNSHRHGYRNYLYYIATEDPAINISRVRNRIMMGGHPVPEDKIVSRYHRSLSLLVSAIQRTDRAYLFDNSGDNQAHTWIAEITDGKILELKTDQMPAWFKNAVFDKLS